MAWAAKPVVTSAKLGRCRNTTAAGPLFEADQVQSPLGGNLVSRLRFVAATGLVLASLSPLTANAQGTTPDDATLAALNTFRTDAANIVTTLPNNKLVTSEQITDSYLDGGLAGLPFEQFNTIMVVRKRAEEAAWDQLDAAQRDLIRSFWNSANNVANAR